MYAILRRWYRHASTWDPNPLLTDMEKVRGRFQYLFQREKPHPPGLSLAIHVEPENMNYEVPSEAEVEAAVRRLLPHRTGGHTHLHAEQFKQWQREAYQINPRRGSAGCV